MTELARRTNSPVGTWKLLSFQYEFEDSDQRDESLGANPVGYLVLTEERLITLMTAREKGDGCSSWRVTRQPDRIFRSLQAAR